MVLTGNYHTLIVHFPVALLSIYTVLELLKTKTKHKYWFHIRSFILYLGVLTGVLAIIAGGLIEDEFAAKFRQLFEIHELYATLAFWIFLILSIAYLIVQFKSFLLKFKLYKRFEKEFDEFVYLIHDSYFSYVLVLLGFIFLTIAGALGGAMVSGPDVDIFVSIIYKLLI